MRLKFILRKAIFKMVFSSVVFLFFFLPAVLIAYFISPKWGRNSILLIFSLLFYAWGETLYTIVMLVSIGSSYIFGRLIDGSAHKKAWLALAIASNLLILGYFKYATFLVEILNPILSPIGIELSSNTSIHLPIGISFFTFQAMSYLIDVYRGTATVQKNPLNLGLYIALFPQLIAGPIVRYNDIAEQLNRRLIDSAKVVEGISRFILGLAKKVLIANNMAVVADTVFALSKDQLSTPLAWIGIIAYSLQIYFDFSGYSDMAIGLGKMFGFDILENFNYPYVAQSVQDFWRRWHISLSNWFRDYLYIPLGGNRQGTARTYINLYIVFFLTGLWHGASWSFIFWGLWHGTFLVFERLGLKGVLESAWRPIRHLYTICVFGFGWIFFRALTLSDAFSYIGRMLFWSTGNGYRTVELVMDSKLWLVMILGILFSIPLGRSYLFQPLKKSKEKLSWLGPSLSVPALALLFFLSIISIASSAYNPFIYFRF